jgi:hypothetical protein
VNELYEVWQHLHFMLNVSWSRSEAAMIHKSGSEVTATFVVFWSVRVGFRAPSIVASPLRPSSHSPRTTKVSLLQCCLPVAAGQDTVLDPSEFWEVLSHG